MSASGTWRATIEVRRELPADADRLARTLGPESRREVPRAHAEIERPEPTVVRLSIEARDTGALRAAVNTYLGWVQLALATEERVARR